MNQTDVSTLPVGINAAVPEKLTEVGTSYLMVTSDLSLEGFEHLNNLGSPTYSQSDIIFSTFMGACGLYKPIDNQN